MVIDYAETHYNTLRFSFAKMLRLHALRPGCWYSIAHLPVAGSHNLSSYLRLKLETYNQVLIQLGLAYKHGKDVRIILKKREEFLLMKEYSFPDCYKAIEYGCYKKNRWQMIRLGGTYDKKQYNPSPELEYIQVLTFLNLERKYSNINTNGISELDILCYASKKLMEIELDCDENNEIDDESGGMRRAVNIDEDGDPIVQYEDCEPSIDVSDRGKYPTLSKLNVDKMKPSTLYSLLREIRKVSVENGNEVFKFEYKIDCGKRRDLIIVPQVKNNVSFQKYVKPVLDNLPKAFVSDSYCRDNGDNCREEEEKIMIRRIFDHYCSQQQDLYVKVANEYGLDFKNKKMSEHFVAAMFAECGIGLTQARILNLYLTAFFGRRVMPQENKIFRDYIAIDELPPVTEVKTLTDNKKVHYFVKPLKEIMKHGIDKEVCEKRQDEVEKLDSIDICWSADHGGGYFRAIVKCSARFRGNGHDGFTFSHRIGQMQCKSDKYELVAATMGPKLDAGFYIYASR